MFTYTSDPGTWAEAPLDEVHTPSVAHLENMELLNILTEAVSDLGLEWSALEQPRESGWMVLICTLAASRMPLRDGAIFP